MFKYSFGFTVVIFFCCVLYGVFNIFAEVEENDCKMTYMFGKPQFSRVNLRAGQHFSKYGLYYYYEGSPVQDVNALRLNGVPVIFVPGNGGSYKQVRSLASVALRKGLDNDQNIHFDYFTVSYDEELSGLYGGYLKNQKRYLELCIESVLELYEQEKQLVIIGHSMGGKVAESVLMNPAVARHINTLITISSPLDTPALNMDEGINNFYAATENFLSKRRPMYLVGNNSNDCCGMRQRSTTSVGFTKREIPLDRLLLISMGGGNRDLLMRSGVTASKYSDVHAMTSSIPNVWLSCDHLSAVWCLQLMLTVNRFLFSISSVDARRNVHLEAKKGPRLQAAASFLIKAKSRLKTTEIDFMRYSNGEAIWQEDSKRVFSKQFKNGLKQTFHQLISLQSQQKYKKLYVELVNVEDEKWVFGCIARVTSAGKNICDKGTPLAQFERLPSKTMLRSMALVDLENIRKTYSNWTHIVVRVPPTKKLVKLHVDIHDPLSRYISMKSPRWFNMKNSVLINETMQGTAYYKILIRDIEDSFQSVTFNIEPLACVDKDYEVATKISVPWANGFTRFKAFDTPNVRKDIIVNTPILSPLGYNTTNNPMALEIFFDPMCRYSISYHYAVDVTMSRIVLGVYHWLPAHLTAVLIIVIRDHIFNFSREDNLRGGKSLRVFFQTASLYIITGCRLMKKLLGFVTFLPEAQLSNYSFYVSVFVHCSAIVISILLAFGVWIALTLEGSLISKLISKCSFLFEAISSVMVSLTTALPISFAVIAVAIGCNCCSGLALLIASGLYFIMLSNAFKDYHENLLWRLTMKLVKRTFSRERTESENTRCEEPGETLTDTEDLQDQECLLSEDMDVKEEWEQCKGLENFVFHLSVMLLLFIVTFLNFGIILAWVKDYRNAFYISDYSLTTSIIILVSLSLIWQLDIPNELCANRLLSVIFYACASASILYCQEDIYRLNYIIAFVFALIVAQELLCRVLRFFQRNH